MLQNYGKTGVDFEVHSLRFTPIATSGAIAAFPAGGIVIAEYRGNNF